MNIFRENFTRICQRSDLVRNQVIFLMDYKYQEPHFSLKNLTMPLFSIKVLDKISKF